MLFNSYEFLLGFFPIVFIGFFLIGRYSREAAAAWLALASLFFYGYWRAAGLPLLLASISVNYWFGLRVTPSATATQARRRAFLVAAITFDLGVLAYFKYANFLVANANAALQAL